jgi:fructokinase
MILVIGEALIDLIGNTGNVHYTAVVGGANANVALALARRGEPQAFLGRISTDGFGQQIRERLESNGVDLSLSVVASEQSSLAVATIGEGGSASYSFYLNGTADWAWTKDELPSTQELVSRGAVCIQYGCLTMAVGPGNLVVEDWLSSLTGLTRSHDLNIRSALGFDRKSELDRVNRINHFSDIIKASDADIEWLYGLDEGSDVDRYALAWAGEEKLVVVTRGGDGASLYKNGQRFDVQAPKIHLVDTVGAGDTFMANFLAELNAVGALEKAGLAAASAAQSTNAARIAAVAAGIVCERRGCEPPSREELLARLD